MQLTKEVNKAILFYKIAFHKELKKYMIKNKLEACFDENNVMYCLRDTEAFLKNNKNKNKKIIIKSYI